MTGWGYIVVFQVVVVTTKLCAVVIQNRDIEDKKIAIYSYSHSIIKIIGVQIISLILVNDCREVIGHSGNIEADRLVEEEQQKSSTYF